MVSKKVIVGALFLTAAASVLPLGKYLSAKEGDSSPARSERAPVSSKLEKTFAENNFKGKIRPAMYWGDSPGIIQTSSVPDWIGEEVVNSYIMTSNTGRTSPVPIYIGTTSGRVHWQPTYGDAGEYEITLRVTDDGGLFDSETITITVNPGVDPSLPMLVKYNRKDNDSMSN